MDDDSRQTAKLPSRGIGAFPCVKCCEQVLSSVELDLRRMLGQAVAESLDAGLDADPTAVLAFIPGTGPTWPLPVKPMPAPQPVTKTPPAVKLLPARVVPVGAVIIAGTDIIASIRAQTVALETLTAVLLLVGEYVATRRKDGSCEQCVRSRVWSQAAPQARIVAKIRRRV